MEGDCHLGPDEKVALYRIAQEALNNVAKHSKASEAKVRLACSDDAVELSVVDNGVGIDREKVSPEHMGLTIMRERADAIGADLDVSRQDSGGTSVVVRRKRAWRETGH
jgi:signal transduction histidine kinase